MVNLAHGMTNMDAGISNAMTWGHVLMAVCAVLYLAWWAIFFRPDIPKVTGALYWVGVACIIGAALAGVAGAIVIGVGVARVPSPPAPSGIWFAIGAVVAYIVLAFVTSRLFGRPITTELVLFVAWTALELASVVSLGASGMFSQGHAAALGIAVVAMFAVMLVTYMLYYNLAALPSFIDGAIPLALVAVFSVAMVVLVRI